MGDTQVVLEGLGFPESTRWRDGRIWLCNWGFGEVLAVTPDGRREVVAQLAPNTLPFSIDWLPDGRLLVIDGPRRTLLRREPDATLTTVGDLTGYGPAPFNELVVDSAGNAYVNGGTGSVVLVRRDGTVRTVADGLLWPNGMALVDHGRTLVVADSHANQLVAFAVAVDATLSNRRVWADLQHAPDGICADAEGAIWVASVPGRHCVRGARRWRRTRDNRRRPRLFRVHAGGRGRSDTVHRRRGVARHGGGHDRGSGRHRAASRRARATGGSCRAPLNDTWITAIGALAANLREGG
jgi:sugar lactone lactonase YvrE